MSNKKIVLTGGGTAGHVMPNVALVPLLTAFDEIHYIGSVGGIEKEIIASHAPNVIYHDIPCVKLIRAFSLQNATIPFKLFSSISKAKKLLYNISPSVVFSKGGFVSLPVCHGAKNVCPVVLHESDKSMGLANKLSKSCCEKILTAFDVDFGEKSEWVGTPLRSELFCGNKQTAKRLCGFTSSRPTLLIMGGSLGATAINEVVENTLDTLINKFNVIHIVGKNNQKNVSAKNYCRIPFSNNINDLYALADFIVCRGGANTLFEVTALHKPALVIPLPTTQSRGDQIENAQYFSSLKTCLVLPQENLTPSSLLLHLNALTNDAETLIENAKKTNNIDGTARIASILSKYAE